MALLALLLVLVQRGLRDFFRAIGYQCIPPVLFVSRVWGRDSTFLNLLPVLELSVEGILLRYSVFWFAHNARYIQRTHEESYCDPVHSSFPTIQARYLKYRLTTIQ